MNTGLDTASVERLSKMLEGSIRTIAREIVREEIEGAKEAFGDLVLDVVRKRLQIDAPAPSDTVSLEGISLITRENHIEVWVEVPGGQVQVIREYLSPDPVISHRVSASGIRRAIQEKLPPALSEGSEGEVEPIGLAPAVIAEMGWDYKSFIVYRDDPGFLTTPLYSHETVQRLQREKERLETMQESGDSVISYLRQRIAHLSDPENWEATDSFGRRINCRYIGPPESEGESDG